MPIRNTPRRLGFILFEDWRVLFCFCALGFVLAMLLSPLFAFGDFVKSQKQRFADWLLE